METATQPTPIEIECQFCSFKGTALEGATHRQETQHLIRIIGEHDAPAPQETPAQQAHTPLPWYYKQPTPFSGCNIYGQEVNGYVATTSGRARANAELIVKCVNRDPAFQKLLEAAELLISEIGGYQNVIQLEGFTKLREALRLAGEGEE